MQESSLAKWLRWLVYSSALVPLVISAQFISPFHFGKVIVLRIIVEVMAVLYLLLIWRDRSYLPKGHLITWAFLAFALAFTLTTFTGVAFLQSFWGTLERMGGLFTFWHYFAFYLIAVSVLRTKHDWQTLFDLMMSAGLVSAFYGFLQRFDLSFILGSGGRERIFGTIGNPALFAGYQILIGFLATTLAFTRQIGPQAGVSHGSAGQGAKWMASGLAGAIIVGLLSSPLEWFGGLWLVPLGLVSYGLYLILADTFTAGRKFYIAVASLTLLAAAMTVVRGSLLAMAAGAVVFALLYSVLFRSVRARKVLVGGISTLVIFLFLGALLRDTPLVQNSPYLRRVTDFSPSTTTVQTRLWAWSAGFKGFSENARTVLVGWGPENFNVPFSKYFNPKFYTGPGAETFFDRAHNMFVEVLVTMGLVGELAYISIFVALFATLARFMKREGDDRILGIGLTALTVAYIIHNFFIFDTSANFLTFFIILAFVTHAAQNGPATGPGKTTRWTGAQQAVAGVLVVAVSVLVWMTNVTPARANFAATRAIVAGWNGDFVQAVNKYREAIAYDVPGRYEYRQRLAQYLLEASNSPDVKKIPNFEQILLASAEDLKQDARENPRDYLPYLYLSRLYITLGKDDAKSPYNALALQNSNKALEISPTFIRTYYEIAQAYLNTHQYDKAFAVFAKAAELNPDVAVTYWYLGIVQYQRGDVQSALQYIETALRKGYGMSENDTLKLINLYVSINDIKDAAVLYGKLTKDHPDNVQYWTSFAVASAKIGQIQDAISAMRTAISLNPNDAAFVQQAQDFLRQLGATP